jgi:PAS domain S-box-containing protein
MPLPVDRLERLVAQSGDIVVATDRSGTVIFYNDGASRILGYSAQEVLGHHVERLYPDLEEAKRVMRAMRSEDFGGVGSCNAFETTYVSKSGERIPVSISGAVIFETGDGKDPVEDGTIGFAKDLREIRHNEKLATLGEVTIGLSHEINNPLAVMVNQTELLEREIQTLAGERDIAVETERLDAIRREIRRISDILKRLAEMAETDTYETVDYVGPARMVDLRRRDARAGHHDLRLSGKSVLVVDDDGGIRKSLEEILALEGCSVSTATDGQEALEMIEAGSFDAVLSDVVMPRMDGYDLYHALREQHPNLPVLMMTAFHYDKDHIIKRSRMEGLPAVIFKKPVDPDKLCETLAACIANAP